MTETDPKPFLSRWAKRKADSRAGQPDLDSPEFPETLEQLDDTADREGADQNDEDAALSDEELCARYELPDPESCTEESQLDGFFDGKVPDRLRQLAMRRIWRLNPLFRIADEMVEYGEDFTDAATVIPNMQTAYKVGKGYLDKLLAEEKQAEAAAAEQMAADQMAADELASEDTASKQVSPENKTPEETPDEKTTEEKTHTRAEDPPAEGTEGEAQTNPPAPEHLAAGSSASAPEHTSAESEPSDQVIRPKRMVFTKNQA